MSDTKAINILNIEDCPFQRAAYSTMLNELGYYNITEACDGEEAISFIVENQYDLILTDINMPKINGIELLSFLKQHNNSSNLIITTSMDKPMIELIKSMSAHLSFGLFEVLPKPCSKSILKELIDKLHRCQCINIKRDNKCKIISANDFKSALTQGDIINYYQPQVSLDDGELLGVEALVRWNHPVYGILSPYEFLHFCQDEDVDITLFETVLRNAIIDCKSHKIECQLSVNISQRCLESDSLIDTIIDITNQYDFDKSMLTIELTESDAYIESLQMLTNLCNLRYHKIKLSIDDFGTGFSSLQKLISYPFCELKIDRSFVSTCLENNTTDTVTQMSIALGKRLGLSIVAEGVENRETLEHLKEIGIDKCQGFYTGRPMPALNIQTFAGRNG
ncbi:EAL domain-containing protein [Shewanella sp. Isolate11]|uniref:EAL domain-containing response regulator n=1 Tax=Shewanella sp. Isolate11 TaxID=2908530 RepID=UPI001EFD5EA8|nr:EAL domain-containing protein [Shewanella sp. Isolate11]MCG9696096.1 EAL domain-containing protein [Shewanella sp. Isolate11]